MIKLSMITGSWVPCLDNQSIFWLVIPFAFHNHGRFDSWRSNHRKGSRSAWFPIWERKCPADFKNWIRNGATTAVAEFPCQMIVRDLTLSDRLFQAHLIAICVDQHTRYTAIDQSPSESSIAGENWTNLRPKVPSFRLIFCRPHDPIIDLPNVPLSIWLAT